MPNQDSPSQFEERQSFGQGRTVFREGEDLEKIHHVAGNDQSPFALARRRNRVQMG